MEFIRKYLNQFTNKAQEAIIVNALKEGNIPVVCLKNDSQLFFVTEITCRLKSLLGQTNSTFAEPSVVHPPEYGLGHRILIKGQPNYFRPEAEWAQMAFIEPAWREVTGWLINELGPDWYSEIDARQGDLQRWFCRGLVGARLGNEVMIPSYLVVSS